MSIDSTNPAGDVAIEGRGLSKLFRFYPSSGDRLREWIAPKRWVRHTEFWALRDVSLSVRRGESLGIVGNNGSGKSTLLKILSGTMNPMAGEVTVHGRCFALLELGTGFNPELTGAENINHVTDMLGLDRSWVSARRDDIIAFSGLGEFIDRPVRTYSSGMSVRLGFSLFSFIEPDILIIDEALAVGDVAFQLKCMRRLDELIYNENRSVIIVSHDTNALARFCDRIIWLDEGRIRMDGDPTEVIAAYIMSNSGTILADRPQEQDETTATTFSQPRVSLPVSEAAVMYLSPDAEIKELWIEDKDGNSTVTVPTSSEFNICYHVRLHKPVSGPVFGTRIVNSRGDIIIASNTYLEDMEAMELQEGAEVIVKWPVRAGLAAGDYFISCGVSHMDDLHDFLVRHLDAYHLKLSGKERTAGFISLADKPVLELLS